LSPVSAANDKRKDPSITVSVSAPADLLGLAGRTLGTTDWRTITQQQVNQFAKATGDHQWIHSDPQRAAAGPYGCTIAHGHLTLSLAPGLIAETLTIEDVSAAVNYGVNRVRFPAPMPVGRSLRATVELVDARVKPVGIQTVFRLTYEANGIQRPVCIADAVVLYI
jgi:acyl dehydratase